MYLDQNIQIYRKSWITNYLAKKKTEKIENGFEKTSRWQSLNSQTFLEPNIQGSTWSNCVGGLNVYSGLVHVDVFFGSEDVSFLISVPLETDGVDFGHSADAEPRP